MSDTDLILRAVSDGNPACPDGPALARLGALVRQGSALDATIELAAQVRERLRDDSVRIEEKTAPTAISDDEIDAAWESPSAEPAADLLQLRRMVGALAPPEPVDLRAAVRARLAEADHRGTVVQLPSGNRWRVLSSALLAHVAAVILIAVLYGALREQRGDEDAVAPVQSSQPNPIQSGSERPAPGPEVPLVLSTVLPARWTDVHELGLDLYALRRDQRLRTMASDHYRTAAARPAIAQGLAWLEAQQHDDGVVGELSGDAARDLATQGFAALAFLGEGDDDPARAAHMRKSLEWISARLDAATDADRGQIATAIATLALVEGAGLGTDPDLRQHAERALALLDGGVPPEAGMSGLGGFILLALETAEQEGLHVPERQLEVARQRIARTAPQVDDCGSLGLAAFAREIYGQRGAPSVGRDLAELERRLPARGSDGSVDPLAWYFATLAMREAGGEAWTTWSQALQTALLSAFQSVGVGACRVPASAAHHALGRGGDVFATSLSILDLQAAYRYLPVDPLVR